MKLGNAIYRHILEMELAGPRPIQSENGIARDLKISPNTVSIAITKLEEVGAVKIYSRHFEVTDFDKALLYWAATRRLKKDIIYATYVKEGTRRIESNMPAEVAYTGCTGYAAFFGNDVSDYSETYVYATGKGADEIRRRFPKAALSKRSNYANLVVLKPDKVLDRLIEKGGLNSSSAPITQIYVDLWNMKEWYAKEFLSRLKKRIDDDRNAKRILQQP